MKISEVFHRPVDSSKHIVANDSSDNSVLNVSYRPTKRALVDKYSEQVNKLPFSRLLKGDLFTNRKRKGVKVMSKFEMEEKLRSFVKGEVKLYPTSFTFFKSYKEMSPCIIDGVVYEYED